MSSAVEQRSTVSPLAGLPAPKEMLVDLERIVSAARKIMNHALAS
jgi:succinate dehydrogenase/fumarate reductase-like Fe-S protein